MLQNLIKIFTLCVTVFVCIHCTDVDILILGAGQSGLGAAIYLHNKNVTNFLVLEAKNRIGGRVHSVPWGDAMVPLGAGWVHVANLNHIGYQLARKYNLSMYKDNYDFSSLVIRDGDSGFEYSQQTREQEEKILLKARSKMDDLIEKRTEDGRFNVDTKTGLRWGGWKATTKLQKAIEYFMFMFENGIENDVMSAWAYGYTGEGGPDSEDYIVTDSRGFNYPMEQEIKPFQDKVKLNTEVRKVERLQDGTYNVTIHNTSSSQNLSYTAKHVMVTFSSGVLLANEVEFKPILPAWKIEALNMAPMCHYCKFYAKFSSKFWDNNGYILFASYVSTAYVHWQNFDVDGLFKGKNILMATLIGTACFESQYRSDDQIKQEMYLALKKVYPNATEPIDFIRNKFSSDRHFHGAYSYQVSGITEDDHVALAHPVKKSLWFAGEYTNGYDFGYVHGAYETGESTVKSILKCMKGDCPTDEPKRTLGKDSCPKSNGKIIHISVFAIMFSIFAYFI